MGTATIPAVIDIMKPEDGAISYRETRKAPIYQSYQGSPEEEYLDSKVGTSNNLGLEAAEERFHNDFKEFQKKKKFEEIVERFEKKYSRDIKNWVKDIRKELLPITKTLSPVKPTMDPEELARRSKFNTIHSNRNLGKHINLKYRFSKD